MKLFYREASIYVLVALLFQTCVASRHGLAPRAVKTPRAPSPMIPISPRIFERDSGAIDYALADDESWTWGSGSVGIANVTALASNNPSLKYLSLERLEGALNGVTYSNNSLEIKLNDAVDFNDLESSWAWVNDAAPSSVIVITTNDAAQARKPYKATKATFDSARRTVVLSASAISWKDAIGGSYTFKLSSSGADGLSPTKRQDINETTVSLASTFDGDIYTSDNLTIDCESCYTTGDLKFELQYGTTGDNYFEVEAENVGAFLDIDLDFEEPLTSALTVTPLTLDVPIPIVTIEEVVSLNLDFAIKLPIHLSPATLKAQTGFDVNVTISEPSTLKISLDASDDSADGWKPTATASWSGISADLDISGSIILEWLLDFTLDVLGTDILDAGLFIYAPDFEFNGTVETDTSGGVCGIESASLGADFEIGVGAEVGAQVDVISIDVYNTVFVSTSTPLYLTCVATSVGSSTATTSATATTTA